MAENAEHDAAVVGDIAAPLMAHHQRLDATTGREVVFCHSCQAEWWKDEHEIMPCPSCGHDFTEIVDPNSDIRPPPVPPHPRQSEMPASQASNMNIADRHHDGDYSDPEEADIRVFSGSNILGGPAMNIQHNSRTRPRAHSDEHGQREDTTSAFATLFHSLLPLGTPLARTPSSQPQSGNGNTPNNSNAAPSPNPPHSQIPFGLFGPPGGPRPGAVVTTRVVMSNGQSPPVTRVYGNMPGNEPIPDLAMYVPPAPSAFNPSNNIASASPFDENAAPPIPPILGSPNAGNELVPVSHTPAAMFRARGPPGLGQRPRLARYHTRVLIIIIRGPADDTRRLFTQMMTNIGGMNGLDGPLAGGAPSPGVVGVNPFQAIIASLLNPGGAVHGDAVYTQEALDRVITQLMEQHQSSGAAPPAPREAIEKLPLKKADEKMVGIEGKASCPVCMEDVVLNDEVVELPCKHWFHEECAKSWLSEHNTCPICRQPISEDAPHEHERGDPNGIPRGQSSSNNPQRGPPPPYAPPAFTFFSSGPRRTSNESRPERRDRLDSIRRAGGITYDEDNMPNIPGSFAYSPPSERISSSMRRPADGTPGGRSFADPSSGAFLDFLNAPVPRDVGTLREREDEDRHSAERAGHRLRRENSYPLAHARSAAPAAHNPYVDAFDLLRGGQVPGQEQAPGRSSVDTNSGRTTHSGGSRGSNGEADRARAGGGGGIGGMLGGLWRRFSGQSNQSQNNEGSGEGR